MRNESVAILDIRSDEISFLLGTKGVNGTFVFSDSRSEKYEGYSLEGFLDEDSFRRAVISVVTSVRQGYEGQIDQIYVGVPAPFVSVYTKGHTISFPAKRKVSAQDVDALFESGLNELLASGRCIHRSEMYFSLGDNRKYFSAEDLYGVPTTMLKGGLCYYFVSEYFYNIVLNVLNDLAVTVKSFVPSALAQANYLLSEKKREGYAFLLDIGFLTTTISVVYGNGTVHEESFNFGTGMIQIALMEGLEIDYEKAEEILLSANISGGIVPKELMFSFESSGEQYSVREINEIIKCSLDDLCEKIENFFARYYKDKKTTGLTVNPISITGEGVGVLKGVAEHISKRLNRLTEVVCPDLPYFDKPAFSSRIALMNAAVSEKKKRSIWYRIFNGFGGKNK